nr:unnamed protein product [Spirometra erinaceieuropaei]
MSTLKPPSHCAMISKKAMGILGAIRRSFLNFDEELFGRVFGAFVRPMLEYCVQAWCPWTKQGYTLLENVQRRATKLVKHKEEGEEDDDAADDDDDDEEEEEEEEEEEKEEKEEGKEEKEDRLRCP